MKTPFLQTLQERVVLGDGAIGTYLYEKGIDVRENTDVLNIKDPDLIISLHEEYIRAGCDLIETNTFGANRFKLNIPDPLKVREINLAGAALASRAAGRSVYVAGSIGPTGIEFPPDSVDITEGDIEEAFSEQISALLEGGVDLLILETFTYLQELEIAIQVARGISSDIPIVAQMVFPAQGRTAMGLDALACANEAVKAGADIFGSNCGRGLKAMLEAIRRLSALKDQIPISAFPNAGLPEVVGHRLVYSAQPSYMAKGISEMIRLGARLVGGCCGTTPSHIHEFRRILHIKGGGASIDIGLSQGLAPEKMEHPMETKGKFLDGLRQNRLPILVELDPPPHLDVQGVTEGAKALARAGVDAITLAEHPLALLRADNLSLASRFKAETGVHTILHLTCRDRNVLGLQSQIMAAHLLGIRAILAITGDPASSSDQPGASGVFDLNSIGLVNMISQFNKGYNLAGKEMREKTSFSIGVAFSYRPSKPELQIRRLEKKLAMGAHFTMTQPLFTAQDVESMMNALKHLNILIFPGIFPLVSARNAEFLHNEIPGISIPEKIRKTLWQYEGVEDQKKAAMEITHGLISEIAPFVDGLYIISPLNKWDISAQITNWIREAGWKGSGRPVKST